MNQSWNKDFINVWIGERSKHIFTLLLSSDKILNFELQKKLSKTFLISLLATLVCTVAKHITEKSLQGPKNFRNLTCPPAILHLSYSYTKKDVPLALPKFLLRRTSGFFGLCNVSWYRPLSCSLIPNCWNDNFHFFCVQKLGCNWLFVVFLVFKHMLYKMCLILSLWHPSKGTCLVP